MGLRLKCIFGAVSVLLLLLLLMVATFHLIKLLVQFVTIQYMLVFGTMALIWLFVDRRRRRYAWGFYSCSCVPQVNPLGKVSQLKGVEEIKAKIKDNGHDKQAHATTSKAPESHEGPLILLHKVVATLPSETESEDDESEGTRLSNITKTPVRSSSSQSMSLVDVCTNTNGELDWGQTARPRSLSVEDGTRPSKAFASGTDLRGLSAVSKDRKHRVPPRRRVDSGITVNGKPIVRSRRATFTSKPDVHSSMSRPSAELLENALHSDGYWIGDFRVQRRLMSHRNNS